MYKSLLTILSFFIAQASFAQYGNVWPLGKMQCIDFNGPDAKLIQTGINNDSTLPVRFSEGHSSSISDCNGQLMFYTNGIDVWNKNDSIMENGRLPRSYPSNVGSRKRSCLIVPHPGDGDIYFIFYIYYLGSASPGGQQFWCAEVDMAANGGLGKVVSKTLIQDDIEASSNLTYAKHANDTDIWIITTPDKTNYNAYKVSSSGLNLTPVVSKGSSQIGSVNGGVDAQWGFIKMTNDYENLVVSGVLPSINANGHVLMYDFNRKTGKLTNELTLVNHTEYPFQYARSIAISPNDSFIYVSLEPLPGYRGRFFSSLLQINRLKKTKLIAYNFPLINGLPQGSSPNGRLGMQTAPDGMIYICLINKIYRVSKPNKLGTQSKVLYWDSLQFMDYSSFQPSYDLNIFSLPNIYMPERKLDFASSSNLKPCGDTTTFTYWGDTTYYKLIWHFGDGDSLVQTQPIKFGGKIKHMYAQDGVYEVKLQAWHAVCNRMKAVSDSIVVKLNPKFTFLPSFRANHGCTSDTLKLWYGVEKANRLNILWNQLDTSSISFSGSDTGLFTKVFYKEQINAIKYILTSANTCSIQLQDSFKSVFNPKPVLNLKVNGFSSRVAIKGKNVYQGCEPMVLNFTDSSKLFKSFKINWYSGDSSLSNDNKISKIEFKNTNKSSNTRGLNSFQTTNQFNCVASDSFYTQVYARPEASFKLDTATLCLRGNLFTVLNNSLYAGNTDSIKTSFDWGDGTIQNSFPNKGHGYLNSGTYKIKLISKAEYGCLDTANANIEVFSHPISKLSLPTVVQCLNNNSFELSLKSKDLYQIKWGDGQFDSNINGGIGLINIHHYLGSGNFIISAIAENANGCFDTSMQMATVKLHPKVSYKLSDSVSCFKSNLFTVISNISYSDLDSVSSVLYFGDGWSFTNPKGNFTQAYAYKNTGNYTIKLVSSSNYGCSDSMEKSVTVHPNPDFALDVKDVCEGNEALFECNWKADADVQKVIWTSNETGTQSHLFSNNETSDQLMHTYTNPGTYSMLVYASNSSLCSTEKNISLNVFRKPQADFDYIKGNSEPQAITYQFYNRSSTATHWFWDFDKEGSDIQENPEYSFKDTGFRKVTLVVTDKNGCTDSLSKVLIVFPEFKFFFPNAVSINRDFLNESFGVSGPQFIHSIELEIYNRWGELIYKTNDKNATWQPELEGVYVYMVKIKDLYLKTHILSGTVTVLK